MRSLHVALLLLILPALIASPTRANVTAYESPTGRIDNAWIDLIRGARTSIHVAVYACTGPDFEFWLADAAQRGVEVTVITDREQAGSTAGWAFIKNLTTASPNAHVIVKHTTGNLMHAKFGVFDGVRLIEGSFNLSAAAQREDNHATVWDAGSGDTGLLWMVQFFETQWEALLLREAGIRYSRSAVMQLPPISYPPAGRQ